MGEKYSACIFCDIEEARVIATNRHAYAIRDGFPVTELHTLVIPKRHVPSYFDLTNDELISLNELVRKLKHEIETHDSTVTGFNIGVNVGESSGQTVFHCHIHIIPRRDGDVDEPRGGVRHVIPGKGYY